MRSKNGLCERSQHSFRLDRRYGRVGAWILAASVFLGTPLLHAQRDVRRGDPHVFRVVDRRGALVGYSVTENLVAREIGGLWVTFYVHTGLGIFDSNAIYLYYATTNCTGTRYVPHYSTFSEGTRVGPKLYYPLDSQVLDPRSLRIVNGAEQEGPCYEVANSRGVFGVVSTVEVESFGLELPFKAVQ